MYTTCAFCAGSLGGDGGASGLGVGRRFAFDPWKSRAWVICAACARWNLTPFDTRVDAIAALEDMAGAGRVAATSEEVTLLRVGGYDVVRIGRPPRVEMATWRYGERIKARRREHLKVYVPVAAVTVGAMVVLNVAAGVGIGGFFGQVPGIIDWTTTRIIGNRRVGVESPMCENCGRLMVLRSKHVQHARLTHSAHADLALLLSCPHCQSLGAQIEGEAAERTLRAGMTYLNLTKRRAVKRKAKEAAVLVESSGGAEELLRRLAREERTVRALGTQQGLALEMAVDEQTELRELERQWKEAEEIAEIADNLGLAKDVEESFRRLKDGHQPNG
jgi:hypothetical protein